MKKTIRFKLNEFTEIPEAWIEPMPLSGPADAVVESIVETYEIEVSPADARVFLERFGAWDSEELRDHNRNVERIIWIATLDCKENDTASFYMGE